MTASAEARLVAGVLAAHDRLGATLSDYIVRFEFANLVQPATVWSPIVLDETTVSEYRFDADREPATWTAPDTDLVESLDSMFRAGWDRVVELANRPSYGPPVLRFAVRSVEDRDQLRAIGRADGIDVTAHIPAPIGAWRWRWPLRIGIVNSPQADQQRTQMLGQGRYADQYVVELVAVDDESDFDVLVVDETAVFVSAKAGAIIITGHALDAADLSALDQRAHAGARLGPGAVVALVDADLSWFESAVRELSHDRTLDAAVGIACPSAFVVGDSRFLGVTAVRSWAFGAADAIEGRHGPLPIVAQLRDVATHARFDSENEGGHRTATAVSGNIGPVVELVGDVGRAIAPPTMAAPPSLTEPEPPPPPPAPIRPQAPPPPGGVQATRPQVTLPGTGSTTLIEEPDRRRVFARVTDPDGNERTDAFVIGVNAIEVSIADKVAGAVGASRSFVSPSPSETIDLEVLINAGRAKPQRRTVRLAPSGNTEWTKPVHVTVGARRTTFRVFVTILWKGRTVQSAVLSGPVVARGTPAGARGLSLEVDVSAAVAGGDRVGADATFVLVPGESGMPVVFDSDRNVSIDPLTLTAANDAVRDVLISTLLQPPKDLRAAAKSLATLAVHGSLLRDALRRKDTTFYDDATWIHVASFAASAVPFELIYTHALPDPDRAKVCAPALAGATSCNGTCEDKDKDDRVCPFGFWGTTKVIERRQHSEDRAAISPSEQRKVSVRAGAVSAVTSLADVDDPTASQRIAGALDAFAQHGSTVRASTWSELESALREPRSLICLVTHTIEPANVGDVLGTKLELGDETKSLVMVDRRYVNPDQRQPGPIVLALGCDTAVVNASYANYVARLHSQGAEIVVSAVAKIPGKEVADFVQRLVHAFEVELARPGEKRFGTVMTAARRATLLEGDVLALALTASGDGDVQVD